MTAELPSAPPLSWWEQGWRLALATGVGVAAFAAVAGDANVILEGPLRWWYRIGDPLIGLTCIALAAFRRRFPITIAATVAVLSTASVAAEGAVILTLCSLATRRRYPETVAVALAGLGTSLLTNSLFYPFHPGGQPAWSGPIVQVAEVITVVAIGISIGAQRDLVLSLRQRAEAAERAQHAQAAEARLLERHRIAREMHDVLAHRISVLSMHAGVLGYRTDLDREQITETAQTIADNAHLALEELREVLGVLRASDTAGDTPEPPQPTPADLGRLVAEARTAGMKVTMIDNTTDELPATSARTAYRIAQEGLTNARKHAHGALVRVRIDGGPGRDLVIQVDNSAPEHPRRATPSGYGLLGLRERAELIGGRIDYGPDTEGGFRLRAVLPWPVGLARSPR
ncbi:sensor histidine kinase [Nocardia panacis]|uniref:histidine kinase n=1 Tax=Nocardia panacis TaxID=2340916 RepID=A0A3A4KRI1_9NOCA|nr:histidine kinase [Nocardia panacis]RJO78727.1 sensor histidine kinase [Nocardia panacis]